jgi:beta-1,2-mannobiose phosphorylase / 1,2-beta-oligomannan phosphorylase
MVGQLEEGPAAAGIHRIGDGPVVAYGSVPGYGPIFNAGAVFHDGRFHLFARAVREAYRRNRGSGARFLNYVSDILVFTSEDGRRYSFQQVLAEGATNGIYAWEDPRVHVVTSDGDRNGHFVMSYTNLPPPEANEFWRIGIHCLTYSDSRFSLDDSSGRVIGPPGEPDKDGIVFNLRDGRVALIHRIYPNMQLAIFDSLAELFDPPAGYWEAHMAELERHILIRPLPTALGVGAGAPPVVTPDGLLLLFHERDGNERYSTKAALLDHETGRVKSVLAKPIMSPELDWERVGDVNNVVFVQGAIPRPDGSIYMTYGAADRAVGAASVSTEELLRALRAAA